MKQILLLLFLLLGAGAANLSAQSTWTTTTEDQYKYDIRQKLNLDYSKPDYTTHKIDPKLMGPAWPPSSRNSVPTTNAQITSVSFQGFRVTR